MIDIHRRLEKKFDLYYYDGLARQDEELRLTVGEHALLRVKCQCNLYGLAWVDSCYRLDNGLEKRYFKVMKKSGKFF